MTDIVVGSGPSGVSVAVARLERGKKVLMIDGGKTPEPEALARRDNLAEKSPDSWSKSERDAYQEVQFSAPVGQVRRYGSDFAQEPAEPILSKKSAWLGLRASHAVGGLSNLWGSAVLPNRQTDILDWPITVDDLLPHYQAVSKFMPVAGTSDALENLLPAFSMDGRKPIPSSAQGGELLRRLAKSPTNLVANGIHHGSARHAVQPQCQQCGMCLHGCPWSYIYSSSHTLAELKRNPNFTHLPGLVADRFSENSKGVSLALSNGETQNGTRVFFASGVLESARIFLESSTQDDELTLKDSQHAFVPMLHRWRSPKNPNLVPFTTLPQAFVEIDEPNISPFLVHSQIYTWNEHYARDLMSSYGKFLPGSAPIWRALARRLIVAQIFLHSDHSAKIGLKLLSKGVLDATLYENSDAAPVLEASKKKLATAMSSAGVSMLGFASRVGAPGSSFHSGGTIPMAKKPVKGNSDTLGRPYGLSRVHFVDSSVLPSIPATTITFSVMANAHRIGILTP